MVDIAVAKKRGRPSKGGTTGAVPAASNSIKASPKKRGRPSKKKGRAVSIKLPGTGKARGRPRKERIPVQENSGNDAADSSEDKPKRERRKKNRKLGRPRKHKPSDEEENDQEQNVKEPRPIGRPSTGAIKWNIVRTGRKVGRPKTKKTANTNYLKTSQPRGQQPKEIILRIEIEPLVFESEEEIEMVSPPKKRGRPSL